MRLTMIATGAALLALGYCALSSDAQACGFIDYRTIRVVEPAKPKAPPKPVPISDQVAAAEQSLDQERFHDAAAQAVGAFPYIRSRQVGESPLGDHAMRILALALVRADGRTSGVTGFPGSTVAERDWNVNWAVTTLRAILAARSEDPVASAQLGEALAARPATEVEASTLLTDLATRDLLGSAHAYAALARLTARSGDGAKTHALLVRCGAMTRTPQTVCSVPAAGVAAR